MKRPLERVHQILAADVGAGTQDILFFNSSINPENNIKFVLPSQTKILAKKVYGIEGDLLVTGRIMGGGPLSNALTRHIKKGHRVFMTEKSAGTIRDDLEEVREEGIEIISEEEAEELEIQKIETQDLDLDFLLEIIRSAGEKIPDFIGIGVQDHGFEKGKSDRAFRFEKIKETLQKDASLKNFLYSEPPAYYTRMKSVLEGIKKDFDGGIAVIDSKFAAVAGALHGVEERPTLSIDVGNGHTMAALVDRELEGIFEHHTHSLSKERLIEYIKRFADGELTNQEVFDDDGHGCYIRDPPGIENVERILVTGPNRDILRNAGLNIEFASPFGDVMMTGPVGIVDLVLEKFF